MCVSPSIRASRPDPSSIPENFNRRIPVCEPILQDA